MRLTYSWRRRGERGAPPIRGTEASRMAGERCACQAARMSFDENPPSPEHLVDARKRTTKVNFGVAIGVAVFLAIGVYAIWYFATRY